MSKTSSCYLLLTILGAVLPLMYFAGFLLENGLDLNLFFAQLWVNSISRFFAMDVLISGIVTIVFVVAETRRLKIKGGNWSLLGLSAGVSVALPLFLLVRSVHIDRQEAK